MPFKLSGPALFAVRHRNCPPLPQVRKYEYPHTALGAGLFRTRPGGFAPADTTNRAFAEFADADQSSDGSIPRKIDKEERSA